MCFGEKVSRNQTWHIAIKDERLLGQPCPLKITLRMNGAY